MMTTNKLTKILSGVVLLGIATAMAAPAQAGILSWEGDTSSFFNFFNDVKPGIKDKDNNIPDTFSVTFSPSTNNPSPDNIAFITTATGVFNPEFSTLQKDKTTTTATGNFAYSSNQTGLAAGEFRYELIPDPNNPPTSDLTFSFPNGASVTWATGTTFIGFFGNDNNDNFVQFDVEGPLPTVAGISPADPILAHRLSFSDRFNSKGKGFGNSRYDALIRTTTTTTEVPEPGTILGLLTVGGLGLVSRFNKQE